MLKRILPPLVLAAMILFGSRGWAEPVRRLTLKDAIQLAVQNHPLLRQAEGVIESQEGSDIQTRSVLWPQINLSNSYSRANSRGSAFGTSEAFTIYNDQFNLNQYIYDFGKTNSEIRASDKLVEQARHNLQNTVEQVLFNVYQSFYQVLENRQAVKVQEESVANLQKHLEQAEAFFHAGTHALIDVTQAEVNLSNGNLSLVQARNNLDVAKAFLRSAIGEGDLGPFEAAGDLSATPFPMNFEEALKTAYSTRPDLQALLAGRESAKAGYDAAKAGYYPAISGSTGYGWRDAVFPPRENSWSFGASISLPIFNGFLTAGQIKQAKGTLDQVTAQVDNLKLTVRQNVEQDYLNMAAAEASLKVAEDTLTYARQNYEIAEGRYKVGVGDYLEYTDAQVNLTSAENGEVQALGNYNIAVSALKQAMGILQ